MGMTTVVEIVGHPKKTDFQAVFDYFDHIDQVFSPFIASSEVSRLNGGSLKLSQISPEMIEVLRLSEETKGQTGGFFDVWYNGKLDPSGLVKGWAIHQAAEILRDLGHRNFYVEAGGDIEVAGTNQEGKSWVIGLKNPFDQSKFAHVVALTEAGIATSGTYLLGQHIYNPHSQKPIQNIVSLTVIGPDVYEADRMATAAFAMGRNGLSFLASQVGLEGFMINSDRSAAMTGGFAPFLIS